LDPHGGNSYLPAALDVTRQAGHNNAEGQEASRRFPHQTRDPPGTAPPTGRQRSDSRQDDNRIAPGSSSSPPPPWDSLFPGFFFSPYVFRGLRHLLPIGATRAQQSAGAVQAGIGARKKPG